MGTPRKINAILLNININRQKLAYMCRYKLATYWQNFTEIHLTRMKILQKVLGGLLFWLTLYTCSGLCHTTLWNRQNNHVYFVLTVSFHYWRCVDRIKCFIVVVVCFSSIQHTKQQKLQRPSASSSYSRIPPCFYYRTLLVWHNYRPIFCRPILSPETRSVVFNHAAPGVSNHKHFLDMVRWPTSQFLEVVS